MSEARLTILCPALEKQYPVRNYEPGPDGLVSVKALVDYFQDAAGSHAHALGVGQDHLLERRLAWLFAGMRVEIFQRPGIHQELKMRTWPTQSNRLYAFRELRLFSESDELLATAGTSWVMIDAQTRRLVRMIDEVRRRHGEGEKSDEKALTAKIPALEQAVHTIKAPVRRGDLDINGHMNSAILCQLMTESAAPELWESRRLRRFEIRFKNECRFGDVLLSSGGDEVFGAVTHLLTRESDGEEVARGVSVWE